MAGKNPTEVQRDQDTPGDESFRDRPDPHPDSHLTVSAVSRPRIPLSKSIHFRLAGSFLGALILIGALQLYFSRYGFMSLLDRISQQVYWELAAELANQIQPTVQNELSPEVVESELHRIGVFVPFTDIYLLDERGTILAAYPNHRGYSVTQVELQPILASVAVESPSLPLYGQNPQIPWQQKVFSAAPIVIAQKPGYVYVVLHGFLMEELYRTSGGFFITRSLIGGFIAISAVSLILALIVYRYLTRRFRDLSVTVSRFQRGDFSVRAASVSQDEIGQLASTINAMADSLVATQAQLQAQEQSRRELVASLAHDIRTPLAATLGHLERAVKLGGEQLADDVRASLLRARESAFFQNGLIAELFELSTLDAINRPADLDYLSPHTIAEKVIESLSVIAGAKAITLRHVISAKQEAIIAADQRLIIRALSNLIDNAIKFTPEHGVVELRIDSFDRAVGFAVADSGPGVPQEARDRIFEAFSQSQPDQRGVGLGLAIAKRIVELHGGTLEILSGEPERPIIDCPGAGPGCVFSFILPEAEEEN